ncbi:cytidine deaminase [Candidatus Woesearchaeota archaeon]|nr:cytidine deaminase [Candidatus Woesearchaeota archaeon]
MIPQEQVDKLIYRATKARDFAYAPYSGYSVGAALLAKSGQIYSGANIERATHDATHAERYALDSAVLANEREFVAIAVVTAGIDAEFPCGKCRQDLTEFDSKGDLEVIAVTLGGKVQRMLLRELLPNSFGPAALGIDVKKY